MVPPNKLGPDLNGKAINETQYRGMIRLLIYLTASRHDIQFSTCLCVRYQANPKESHLIDVKRISRYLKGTPSLGLWYPKCSGFNLKGYSNSDYDGCNMDKKSTSGACQLLEGKLVPIFCDNTSAIAIANNPVLHLRTKHIDIRYHFIRDHILKGDIGLHSIPTQYQLADVFTKPLDEPTFKRLIVELGYNGEIKVKGTLKKSFLPPRRKQSSKHTSESNTKASKSKTGQSKKETQSSSTKDKSPSYPSPPTPVVDEMHKEAQQAAGGSTSLGSTIEEGAHPQLSSGHDALADSTAEVDPGLSAPNDSIPIQQDQTKSARDGLKTAHTDLDIRYVFFTPGSLQDKLIIVSNESEEEETEKDKDTHVTSHNIPEDTLVPHPTSPKSAQIQELMAQVHLLQSQKEKLEQQKAKAKEDFASLKAKTS
nr:hypothetical protein [Tanacetum cinerariifolium]